jgi:hypothetical protein
VLNAVAAILVRKDEIIATVCHDPKPDVVAGRETNKTAAYEIFAMWNTVPEDVLYFQPIPFDGSEDMSGVTAMTNPRDADMYFEGTDDREFCLQTPQGKSHLGIVNQSDASSVLIKCLEIP